MFLVDTHVLIWSVSSPELLPLRVRAVVESGLMKASVVSLWEMILKKNRPHSPVHAPLDWWDRYIVQGGIETLPITSKHVSRLDSLPEFHRDPFDRMLIAQAESEGLQIVSADQAIARYVDTIWV